ncbi:MAG: fluoride efflux transporter CrcB [Candidatus Omnitrophica bacterium]|nr:fluoride efflux transporter CrcB [Candidatus Omnitrophota bacterium]
MEKIIFLATGGAIGATMRYFIFGLIEKHMHGVFFWETLTVNVLGSLVAGFLWGIFETFSVSPNLRLFIFVGILGALTTFSTFSLETFYLMRDGEMKLALLNILANNVFCITAVFVGFFLSKPLVNFFN